MSDQMSDQGWKDIEFKCGDTKESIRVNKILDKTDQTRMKEKIADFAGGTSSDKIKITTSKGSRLDLSDLYYTTEDDEPINVELIKASELAQMAAINVFYSIEGVATSYYVRIQVPPNRKLCLSDFKNAVNKNHADDYNHFCKIMIDGKVSQMPLIHDNDELVIQDGIITIYLEQKDISTRTKQNHRYLCTEPSTPIASVGTLNYKQLSPTTITNQLKTDITIFMNNLNTLEDNQTYLKMTNQSIDDEFFLSKQNIFIRKSYCTLYNIINEKIKDDEKHPFIVLGNPGIGKSFFGFYLIWKLIQDKQPFLYKPQASIFKDNHFIYCTFETLPYNARLFDYEKEALSYNEKKEAWYISDTSYPSESFANSCKRSVYITSPKSMGEDSINRRRNLVLKDPNLYRLFMPTWSKEEFSELCDCFYPSETKKKTQY